MKTRCLNPKNRAWKYYGGRGITICERWLKFENFFADMGERPEGMSIERVDTDGNYEPDNCKWATVDEQAASRRNGWRYMERFQPLVLVAKYEESPESGLERYLRVATLRAIGFANAEEVRP